MLFQPAVPLEPLVLLQHPLLLLLARTTLEENDNYQKHTEKYMLQYGYDLPPLYLTPYFHNCLGSGQGSEHSKNYL